MYRETESYLFQVNWTDGVPYAHLKVFEWKLSVYKELLSLWKTVLAILKEKGEPCLFTCIPPGDDKLYKFQRMFCLTEVERTDEYILMYADTGV